MAKRCRLRTRGPVPPKGRATIGNHLTRRCCRRGRWCARSRSAIVGPVRPRGPGARAFAPPVIARTTEASSDRVLKYIELKTGHSDYGPAWIARVTLSKSARTIYFNGKAPKRANGGCVSGNHY